jgi:hypothetical protein
MDGEWLQKTVPLIRKPSAQRNPVPNSPARGSMEGMETVQRHAKKIRHGLRFDPRNVQPAQEF